MPDAVVDRIETVRAPNIPPSEGLSHAIRSFERTVPTLLAPKEAISSAKILDRVLDWEEENYDRVSPDEIEALTTLSLVIGTVDAIVNKVNMNKFQTSEEAYMMSISTQREITKLILKNLDEEGRPNEKMVRTASLITKVFENVFRPGPDKYYEKGLEGEANFWQGVMGMVTAAQMFDLIGWEVGFGPVALDRRNDVDLVATSPKGERFTVDITSRAKGFVVGDNLFRITVVPERSRDVIKTLSNIRGRIILNVPPLRTLEFESFYDSSHRSTGTPSQSAIETFRKRVSA